MDSVQSVSIGELARRWSQETVGRFSEGRLLDLLMASFWRGDFDGNAARLGEPFGHRTALALIRGLQCVLEAHNAADAIGGSIRIVTERPAATEQLLPDGGREVDVTIYIALPADEGAWSDDMIGAATAQLTAVCFGDFNEPFRIALMGQVVHKDDVLRLCRRLRIEAPSFWRRASDQPAGRAGAITSCRRWLASLGNDDADRTKAQVFGEAKRRFPGLSQRGFDSAWASSAPALMKKPGPRTHSRRHRAS